MLITLIILIIIISCCSLISSAIGGYFGYKTFTDSTSSESDNSDNSSGTNDTNGTNNTSGSNGSNGSGSTNNTGGSGSTNNTGGSGSTTGTCGYPEGEKPILDISKGDLGMIIGMSQGKKYTWDSAPFQYIKLHNYNVSKYTVDVMINGGSYECKTFDAPDDNRIIVFDVYNGEDYEYTYENGNMMLKDSSGNHELSLA